MGDSVSVTEEIAADPKLTRGRSVAEDMFVNSISIKVAQAKMTKESLASEKGRHGRSPSTVESEGCDDHAE
jgi:hypothetical protein